MLKVSLSYELMSHLFEKDEEYEQLMLAMQWLEKIHAAVYVDDITLLLLFEDKKIPSLSSLPFKNVNILKINDFKYTTQIEKEVLNDWYRTYLTNSEYHLFNKKRKQIWDLFHLRANMGHLQCLKKAKIDLILSQDILLNKMAKSLGVDQYVYDISSFIDRCEVDYPQANPFKGISIHLVTFSEIDVNDSFFDSFRQEYKEFNQWFYKKQNEKAYVVWDTKQNVRAFLYLKVELWTEDYNMIHPTFNSAKRLKIGSFKVDMHGERIFERFLYIVFQKALMEHVKEIYITLFLKYQSRVLLKEQLTKWGFEFWGLKDSQEEVLVKSLFKHDNGKYRECFPFHKRPQRAYVVRLDELYETALFGKNQLSFTKEENLYPLRKLLICQGNRMEISRGDVLFFYCISQHRICRIGLVEDVLHSFKTEKDFIYACKKRSIFSRNQLIRYWNYRKPPFVLKFLNSYEVSFNDSVQMEKELSELKETFLHLQPIDMDIFNKMIKGTEYEKYIVVD